MFARLLTAAGAIALTVALLHAGGAVAQGQKIQPQAKGQKTGPSAALCKAEDERLRALAGRLRLQVEGPAARPIHEPIRLSLSGVEAVRAAGILTDDTHFYAYFTFDSSVSVADYSSAPWSTNRSRAPAGEAANVRSRQSLRFPVYFRVDYADRQWAIVNANTVGELQITSGVAVRSSCGERLLTTPVRHTLNILPDPREAEIAAGGTTGRCEVEAAYFKRLAAQVKVEIERPGSAKVGEPVKVTWGRTGERFLMSRPAFIVLTMREEVRFQGLDMIPIPPGARVPTGIQYGAGQMRVFVPLSTRSAPTSGTFFIKPFRSGSFPIGHAVVIRTSCGEIVQAETKTSVDVLPGPAEMVVQDFFSLEKPERVAIAGNGRFRLEVFKASYRVYDTATSVKIVDRVGRSPNLSPTGRFVAAYLQGSDGGGGVMEVIDLMTREPIPMLSLFGPTIAWGLGDAVIVEGTFGHPELAIRRALVDPDPQIPSGLGEIGAIKVSTSGRGSSAWQRFRFGLAIDQGFVAIIDREVQDDDWGSYSLFDLANGRKISTVTASGVPSAKRGVDPQNVSMGLEANDIAHIMELHGRPGFEIPDGWSLGESLRLSHYSPTVDRLVAENDAFSKRYQPKVGGVRAGSQVTYHHESRPPPNATAAPAVRVASANVAETSGAEDWRARSARRDKALTGISDHIRFARQLEPFGLCIDPGCSKSSRRDVPRSWVVSSSFVEWSYQKGTQTTVFTAPPAEIERLLVRDVPVAKSVIRGKPNEICFAHQSDEFLASVEKLPASDRHFPFRFIPSPKTGRGVIGAGGNTDVHGTWSWSFEGRTHWLVQTVCVYAGIQNSPVTLFVSSVNRGQGAIYQYGGGAGLDANASADLNDDFNGSDNEFLLRVRPSIVDDRWLLIAAPASSSAAIVDLRAPGQMKVVKKMHDVFATQELFRSKDGRNLVQLNTDGRFYVYRIADSAHVISGRWVDDEIVFVTDEGYFDGTYEGAQFMHLRFPGVDGVFSLAQFERTLRRPDLIKAMIAGQQVNVEPPQLIVPPQVEMVLGAFASGRPSIGIKASSARGLKAIRLFEDGRLLRRIEVSGTAVTTQADLGQMPSGRWLTAIAEDEAGVLSAPETLAVPKPSAAQRRLHGVVVGVDRYAEEHLALHYASSDARKIAEAVRTTRGGYYAQARITPLVNEEAGADAIVKALERAIDDAAPGDTVLFTFAGHGVRAPDGSYVLTASGFHSSVPAESGLAWSRVSAVLARSKARVIVVLDACRSGLTGAAGLATNDDAVADILKGTTAPIVVFAAAKGRQDSYEDDIRATNPRWGGGVFTNALVGALSDGWQAHDTNGNGALEISELYRAVKAKVVGDTSGAQTPWLVRQDLVGDFAIF